MTKGSDVYVNQENYTDGDAKPADATLGQKLKATNGKVWEWSGTAWLLIVDTSSDGELAIPAVAVHGATIRISNYTGKITSTEDGATFARAPDATRLLLQNLELTSITEFAVIAFGTTAANAQSNLNKSGSTPNIISNSGGAIRSGDSTLGVLAPDFILDWPANATHAALGNGAAGDDQIVMVSQGVA